MRASLRKKSFGHLTNFIQKANMCQVLRTGVGGTHGSKIQGGAGKLRVRSSIRESQVAPKMQVIRTRRQTVASQPCLLQSPFLRQLVASFVAEGLRILIYTKWLYGSFWVVWLHSQQKPM